ncbi:hypothetical protein KKI24_13225 [bacterium]|nr:hypothetical protein [bacterium]
MKGYLKPVLISVVALCLLPGNAKAANDTLYSFDARDFSKKTWEWKGDILITATSKQLDRKSVLYAVKYPGEEPSQITELESQLTLESRWDWDWSRLILAGRTMAHRSDLDGADTEESVLTEGYWQFSALDPHNGEIGKRLLRWGKGYAFNPVAFLERVKNPEDPEDSREGLWMVQGIWIPGGFSIFDNSSLNLVYLPIRQDLNDDFVTRPTESEDWGLRLYTLVGTADFDLYIVQKQDTHETDWGFDFAANVTPSFEVHGEYASIDSDDTASYQAFLLGARYLTENDVTWIMETYHNSSGLTEKESTALFASAHSGSATALRQLVSLTQKSRTLNQNYAYLKASIKEPFDWLYFTPSMAWLVNLDDSSANMNLQLTYTPASNWLFQTSWQHLAGETHTQYGEGIVQDKIVLEAGYSF